MIKKYTKNPFKVTEKPEITTKDVLIVAGMFAVGLALLFLIIFLHPKYKEVGYDCRLAEISPDIPQRVKEECRKMSLHTRNRK
jgi:hypothetical protein